MYEITIASLIFCMSLGTICVHSQYRWNHVLTQSIFIQLLIMILTFGILAFLLDVLKPLLFFLYLLFFSVAGYSLALGVYMIFVPDKVSIKKEYRVAKKARIIGLMMVAFVIFSSSFI